MGIKNLMQLIKEYDGVQTTLDAMLLEDKTIGIDTSIYIYKYLPGYLNDFYSVLEDSTILNNEERTKIEKNNDSTICRGLSNKIVELFNYIRSKRNIEFVFLLDGENKPDLKMEYACNERKISKDRMREKMQTKVAEGDADSVRKTLTYTYKLPSIFNGIFRETVEENGYKCITADGEAETYACTLIKKGDIDYILTTDTDCLAMQCDIITRICADFFTIVKYDQLLKETGLTAEQFLDFCILCGCDYNQKIPGIGVKRALALIKKHGSIESIGDNTKHNVSCLNADQCRTLFTL